MLSERSDAVLRIVSLLKEVGFKTSDIYNSRKACFDLVARKEDLILLVKALTNLDGFQEEQAFQLKLLCFVLSASPILVGERTRKDKVEDDVLYERYGLPAVSFSTLRQALLHGVFPVIYAKRGGFFVHLNGDKIRYERERESFSLGSLAQNLGVSRRAIYEYERNEMDSTLETAIKLEKLFGNPVASPLNILSWKVEHEAIEDGNTAESLDDELEETVGQVLSDLGLKVVWSKRTPFDALTYREELSDLMVTGVGHASERKVESRIQAVGSFSGIVRSLAMFVLDRPHSIISKGVPVMSKDELESMDDASQLLRTISMRMHGKRDN
ncbi:MAG: transcriptional regulator [Candidatus Atabeyarchaeum deiterrae]